MIKTSRATQGLHSSAERPLRTIFWRDNDMLLSDNLVQRVDVLILRTPPTISHSAG
jgi:hypothetical protein